MSVVKVQFTRVENEAEVNNTQIKDGQLLYTRDGKLYMDYGTTRKKLTSLIELLTVDSTAPSECSIGDMYYNTTTSLIYTAIGTDTWSSTGTTPSTKYLYVDLTNAKLYYYDGVTFTSYGGGSVDADTEMSDSSTNPVQNKVIKEYIDNQISIGSTEPTDEENKLWINTGEIRSAVSEITNEYSTSTGLGYSCNFINGTVLYEDATGTNDDVSLSDSANNYRYLEIYYGDSDDDYKLCYKCFNANGKQIILSMNAPTAIALYINTSRYTINGTSIEFMNAIQIQILPGKTIGNYTYKDTTAYSYIRKVIGYK